VRWERNKGGENFLDARDAKGKGAKQSTQSVPPIGKSDEVGLGTATKGGGRRLIWTKKGFQEGRGHDGRCRKGGKGEGNYDSLSFKQKG